MSKDIYICKIASTNSFQNINNILLFALNLVLLLIITKNVLGNYGIVKTVVKNTIKQEIQDIELIVIINVNQNIDG